MPRSPTKNDLRDQQIKDLHDKIEVLDRKTGTISDGVKNFINAQEELGDTILPMQRVFGFTTAGIFALVGLIVIIYSGTKVKDEDTRDHLYVYGSVFLVLGIIIAIAVHFYTKYINISRTKGIFNNFNFDKKNVTNLLQK
tara:strand:- start:300 stop:719 length:420 start_codon:yes stop_codon:yes gene_type:complete